MYMYIFNLLKFNKNILKTNKKFVTVINQAEVAYREFLGTNRSKILPGLCFNIPYIHTLYRIDMKESGDKIKNINAYTKDGVPVTISGTLFYQVIDANKACFQVNNYIKSVLAVGESAIRSTIGQLNYDEITSERQTINQILVKTIGDNIIKWGVMCTKFEIQEFEPSNHHIRTSLEKQMEAERNRRENDLNTLAKIRSAEGDKDSAKFRADGEFYAKQKQADSIAYALDVQTKAMKNQLMDIKDVLGEKYSQYILESKKIDGLQEIAKSANKQVYFINPDGILPSFKILSDILNENKKNKDL